MKIVSWNVNSINARGEHVKDFLNGAQPDVLMLQELKTQDFPAAEFEALGYHSFVKGQKSYNGVAILSKHDITPIRDALPGDDTDEQARYLEADINGIRVINIYLPNGNPVEDGQHKKFLYKLAWMDRLITHLKSLRAQDIPFLIGGDFNIIPSDIDCHDPNKWRGDALFHPQSLKRWHTLLNLGLTDAYRIHNYAAESYTFWDYQAGAWPKNHGIRIDHFLTSPQITDRIESCAIDKNPRGWDRPSDHTPIALTLQNA